MKLLYKGMVMDHDETEWLKSTPNGLQEITLAREETITAYILEGLYNYMHNEGLFAHRPTDEELRECAICLCDLLFHRPKGAVDAYVDRVEKRMPGLAGEPHKKEGLAN